MGTISNSNYPPHPPWMTSEQVLAIEDPLLRNIVAHLLDQLEDGPLAIYTFERSLFTESELTAIELIEQVRRLLQIVARIGSRIVTLTSLEDDTMKVTFHRQ